LAAALPPLLRTDGPPPEVPHRVPLGLLLLDRGFVDREQLKRALQAQKDAGTGRVGEWLRHLGAVTEEPVTQALGAQWSMPVFPLHQTRRYLECAQLIPLRLLQAVEMVPVHYLPASRELHIAFVDRVNYTALYSVEKMLDCHTEPSLAPQSVVQQALREICAQPRPGEVVLDQPADPACLAETAASYARKLAAENVKLSGFGGFVWLRFLSPGGHNDLLFRTRSDQPQATPPAIPSEE
jgi:hypothetical protein